jgi:argininosuccinate synthase
MLKWGIFKIQKRLPLFWMLVRIQWNEAMVIKLNKKPVIAKAALKGLNKKTPTSLIGRIAAIERKMAALSQSDRPRNPTAATLRALKQLKSGKLTRYVDEDDMFRKLGIKVGKT